MLPYRNPALDEAYGAQLSRLAGGGFVLDDPHHHGPGHDDAHGSGS